MNGMQMSANSQALKSTDLALTTWCPEAKERVVKRTESGVEVGKKTEAKEECQ